jgi:outer membrane immunogenic protein
VVGIYAWNCSGLRSSERGKCRLGGCLPVAPAPYIPPPVLPPVYSWTGFYIGLNAGGTFAHESDTATFVGGPLSGLSASGTSNGNGAVAGGQAGFNWQSNALVLGIEGDFDWSGLQGSDTAGIVSQSTKMPWIATIRGRVGAAFDRLLVYGTAGAAFQDFSQSITAAGIGTLFSASQVDYGWTAGAGIESAFAPNWTARVEYLFVDTSMSLSGPVNLIGGTLSHSGTLEQNIIRSGINYKF